MKSSDGKLSSGIIYNAISDLTSIVVDEMETCKTRLNSAETLIRDISIMEYAGTASVDKHICKLEKALSEITHNPLEKGSDRVRAGKLLVTLEAQRLDNLYC